MNPVRRWLVIGMLLSMGRAFAASPPVSFPVFRTADARPVMVVATVSEGAELPAPESCDQGHVVCLEGHYWFKARVLSVIAGSLDEDTVSVVTTSHDRGDLNLLLAARSPWLLSLLVHGDDVWTGAHDHALLTARKDGALFLLDFGSGWPASFPCAMRDLREPIDKDQFPAGTGIDPEDFDWFEVRQHRDAFRIDLDGAFPRFGIRLSRLRASLTGDAPRRSIRCDRPWKSVGPPPSSKRQRRQR